VLDRRFGWARCVVVGTLFAAKILPIAPATASASAPAFTPVAFAELALLFVLRGFAVLWRRDGASARIAGALDRIAGARFLSVDVCRRLQGQRALLMPLIILEWTIAVASATAAAAAPTAIGVTLLLMLARFSRNRFLRRILGAIRFGFLDDFRFGLLFDNRRSVFNLRYGPRAAFRIA
jgi:hypothetical protein